MEDENASRRSAELRRQVREYVWFSIALIFVMSLVALKSHV
jgi:hypothetical protein